MNKLRKSLLLLYSIRGQCMVSHHRDSSFLSSCLWSPSLWEAVWATRWRWW